MTIIARSRNGKTFDMEKRQISIIHDLYYSNRKAATKGGSMGEFRIADCELRIWRRWICGLLAHEKRT
jgi:hypothetical protein